ncbi:Cell-division control histidine kinase PdhS [compost metagenome]
MIFDFFQNKECQEINNFYKKLFEEIPDLIFQFLIAPDNVYSFPLVSKSVTEIFELSNDHFSDSSKQIIYNRIFEEDRNPFFQSLIFSRKNLSRWELEFRVVLPEKGLRWLKVSSKPELFPDGSIAFYGRISDITELKDQELKLRISEERFQFALDASTAGIWDWDMRTNKVFYSSLSMKILDLESTDIFDNPERWDEIVHEDDLEKYYSDIQEHFDNKIPFYENYHRVLTSSGKYKWILDRGKVIERDPDGKPLRVIGTHTDISAQKEKELELIKTMELYSQQNSRLLNFSHIVSHNLNTQAGNIKSILDLMDYDANLVGNSEMLSHLRTVSDDLNDTIANLTQLVAIQSDLNIDVKPLQLNRYVKKIIGIISTCNDASKVTIINSVSDDAVIHFNPAYLESVLLNFTTNAIKYSHPERHPIIEFSFSIENGSKVLSVADNGLGIDLDRHGEMLFGLYKTFHKHQDAQGIGLYITKNQIEAMKGKVTVNSKVGEGTVFKIIFND